MWLILIPILLFLVNICDSLETSIQNNPAEASIFQYVLWFILVTIGDIMALIVIAGVCVAISDLFKFICRFIKKQSYSYNLSHYQDSLNSIKNIISELNEKTKCIETLKDIKTPDNYEMGFDDFPKEKGSSNWGATFTVYLSDDSMVIHTKKDCCDNLEHHNIFWFHRLFNISTIPLCEKCSNNFTYPDLSWCDKYIYEKEVFKLQQELQFKQPILIKQHKKCNSFFVKFQLIFTIKGRRKLKELNRLYEQLFST